MKPIRRATSRTPPPMPPSALHEKHRLGGGRTIRRVRVLVPQEVVKTVCEPIANKRHPANSYDAQFSIPYIVATGLLKGRFTLDELEDKALGDAAVLNLASPRRLRSRSRPRPSRGTIRAKSLSRREDGRRLRHREAVNRGCADRPLSNDDVVEPNSSTTPSAPSRARGGKRVADAVLALDRQNARALADVLCAGR